MSARNILKGFLNATMFDMAVSSGRTLLSNYNLLDNGEDAFYWWSHSYIRSFLNNYFHLTVSGEDNVPSKSPGGLIFCSNHSSFLDPIVVSAASTFHQIHWLGKFEHFIEDPIVKSIFSMWSAIPIHRGQSDQAAMQRAIDYLDGGHSVGVFPEGTRSLDGHIGKLHNGAAKLAVTTGATIIPVGTVGMIKALRKGQMLPKPVPVSVEFGKPIYTRDIKGQQEDWELVRSVTTQIDEALHRMVGDRNVL
jgi:1-acyl-sn-glycerol-3-phosphate acyltransferase